MRYPAVFIYEPDQEIAVIFPDFDVATSGVDEADALAFAKELLELTLFGFREDGKPLPDLQSLVILLPRKTRGWLWFQQLFDSYWAKQSSSPIVASLLKFGV